MQAKGGQAEAVMQGQRQYSQQGGEREWAEEDVV